MIEILENRSLLSATVTSLGTATDHSNLDTTVPVSATAAVPLNQTLIVEVACDNTNGNGVTVTDDQDNTYTEDAHVFQPGTPGTGVWLFSAPVTSALSMGDHITATFTAGIGGVPVAKAVSVLAVDGLVTSSALDQTATSAGANASPDSGSTSTTNYADELLIGAIAVGADNTVGFTEGANYTLIGSTGTNGAGSNATIYPEYRIVNATGQYNADGTIAAANKWAAAIGTYVIDVSPEITPTPNQTNDEADPVSLQINATSPSGGTLQYSAAGLPDGLSIDSSTGLISGMISGVAADQSQPINVDVAVSDGVLTSHDMFTWTVNNVAPLLTADDVSMTEGTASPVTVGTFTDIGGPEPQGNYTAMIDWGDGTSSAGSITESGSTFTVQGSHAYAEDGSFPLVVTVDDDNGITLVSSTANSNATVAEGAITATGVPVNGFEFSPPTNVPVATFTHANGIEPASDYSATIDWGDGTTSAGTISLSGGVYTVSGSHMYTDENNYTVTVQIQDNGPGEGAGASATASTTATILEELLPDGSRGTPNQRFISELYRDLLNRPVDPGGLAHWNGMLDAGVSRTDIAFQIEQTTEYVNDVVQGLYQQYLNRAADPGGLSYYASLMQAGATIEQVAADIAASDEFFADQGGTNADFVNGLYQDALGRDAGPGGLAYFTGQLAGGVTREQVAGEVLSSQEYRNDVVSQAYEHLLDRPADPAGQAGWVSVLNAGGTDQQVYAGMCGSQEFYNKTVP